MSHFQEEYSEHMSVFEHARRILQMNPYAFRRHHFLQTTDEKALALIQSSLRLCHDEPPQQSRRWLSVHC